jgi:hypothetical protein
MPNMIIGPMRSNGRERGALGDTELRRQIANALRGEPFLGQCCIRPDGSDELPRAVVLFPEGAAGLIEIAVDEGRVVLRGQVQSAAQKELAATITAGVRGCGRVLNALAVAD